MKKKQELKATNSNFDRNEQFDFDSIPKHFDSVTDESLSEIKESIMSDIAGTTEFEPGALEDALRGVDSRFKGSYATLEGDYATRRANLKVAFTNGLSGLIRDFKQFELMVEKHNTAYKEYSAANKVIFGTDLSERLKVSDGELSEMESSIKKIEGNQENA